MNQPLPPAVPTGREPRQRWQLRFARRPPALRTKQQDLITEFERALREAGLPLSYTTARRPRPRLRLAANIPVGIELRDELLEAYFDELVPRERIQAAAELFPDGVELVDAREVWHGFPSAASQLSAAEYEVQLSGPATAEPDDLRSALERLTAAPSLPGMARRGETERRTDAGSRDLRPLILEAELLDTDPDAGVARLRTVLRLDATGAGRPEDVVRALRLPLRIDRVVRTRLIFVDTPGGGR